MTTPINKENFLSELSQALKGRYSFAVTKNIMADVLLCLDENTMKESIELMDIDVWMANCCAALEMPIGTVLSKTRKKECVYVRNAFAFILTNVYRLKQEDACDYIGLDRSTISSACKKVKEDFETRHQQFLEVYNVCYKQLFKQAA